MGRCKICNRLQSDHEVAERSGEIHHKFSSSGALEALEPAGSTKPGTRVAPENVIVARLAVLLSSKGLISEEDVIYVITGVASSPIGQSTESTSGPNPTESPS